MHSLESHLRAVWVEKHGDYYLSTIYRTPSSLRIAKLPDFINIPRSLCGSKLYQIPKWNWSEHKDERGREMIPYLISALTLHSDQQSALQSAMWWTLQINHIAAIWTKRAHSQTRQQKDNSYNLTCNTVQFPLHVQPHRNIQFCIGCCQFSWQNVRL